MWLAHRINSTRNIGVPRPFLNSSKFTLHNPTLWCERTCSSILGSGHPQCRMCLRTMLTISTWYFQWVSSPSEGMTSRWLSSSSTSVPINNGYSITRRLKVLLAMYYVKLSSSELTRSTALWIHKHLACISLSVNTMLCTNVISLRIRW